MSASSVSAVVAARQAISRPRDLAHSNKLPRGRVVCVRDSRTGQEIEIDRFKSRLDRLRGRVDAWCQAVDDYLKACGHGYRLVMVRLSYRPGAYWRPGQISAYVRRLSRHLRGDLIAYADVAEVQERGAVHYHLMVLVRAGADVPLPDASGMWPHGSSNVQTARSPWYLKSYTGKESQKRNLPRGIRAFTVWVRPSAVGRMRLWRFRVSSLPRWMRDIVGAGVVELVEAGQDWWKRADGGGYVWRGAVFRSPYTLVEGV